jgi:butyryl-CoA dehydrogenase
MLRKTCRDFADRELKPIAAEIDKTHRYPTEIVRFISRDKPHKIKRIYLG